MNRIIVVTGGAGGIGRCIVAHFASQGDSVYFIDQNQQATLTQVEKMRERGWQVTGFVGDVAEKQALEEFAALVLREHPEGIHCLINNACLMRGGILSDCDYEDFLYVQRVGVVALYAGPVVQRPFPRDGSDCKHFVYACFSIAAGYGELYGSQRRNYCADPCFGR